MKAKRHNLEKIVYAFVGILVFLRLLIYHNYVLGRENYFYSDDAVYAILSSRFLHGDFWNAFHPYWSPGFPLATIPFYLASQSWETSQFLVSAFSATLLILVLFWFFKRYSLSLALAVAFITAFSVSLQILVVSGGITEPLYVLLLWLGICVGWLAITTRKSRFYIFAGIFFGLAYLTRTEAIVFLVLFLLIASLSQLFGKKNMKIRLKVWATTVGAAILFFLLPNLPYITFQSLQIGRLTLSGKYAFIGTGPYYALEKDRPTTLVQDVWAVDYADYSSPYYNPDRAKNFMIKYVRNGTIPQGAKKIFLESLELYKSVNTSNFFVKHWLYVALAGFVLGVLHNKFRKLTLYFTVLWLSGLIWVSVFMAAHYRYLVYALPFFFYLQAIAVCSIGWVVIWVARLVFKTKWTDKVAGGVSMILPVLLLADFLMKNTSVQALTSIQASGRFKDHKIIGEWIKSQGIKVFGGRMEAIRFYSDAKLVYMPSETPDKIVKYMKAWGIEYLLVRPNEVGYAHVAPIADPKYKNPDLTLVHQFYEGSLIWRIKLSDAEKSYNERTKRRDRIRSLF
ncbi:MAG: hypothetical protein Q7S60_00950 [bacterium]|nr:hypothetical protein [bacterium]